MYRYRTHESNPIQSYLLPYQNAPSDHILNSSFPTGSTTDPLRHNESERSILRMMHDARAAGGESLVMNESK